MILIPSDPLRSTLVANRTGFFLEGADASRKVVMVVKASDAVVQHLRLGTPTYLWAGLVDLSYGSVVCSTLSIADDPHDPWVLRRTLDPGEVAMLRRMLVQPEVEVYVFDELNRNVLSLRASHHGSEAILGGLSNESTNLVGTSKADTERALRIVVDREAQEPSFLWAISLQPKSAKLIKITHLGNNPGGPPDDPERFTRAHSVEVPPGGLSLEVKVARMLGRLFPAERIFAAPPRQDDAKRREFIDVVAFDDSGILLVEAKSAPVGEDTRHQSSQRRASNLVKHVNKGLKQLKGAARHAMRQGKVGLESAEGKVEVPLNGRLMALVLVVSDWDDPIVKDEIASTVTATASEVSATVGVISLMDFAQIVENARDSRDFFARICGASGDFEAS